MIQEKYLRRLKISICIAIVTFIPFLITFDVKPPQVDKKESFNLSTKSPEYLLDPINTVALLVSAFVDYPAIAKPPPKGLNHRLQTMIEENDVQQQKYEYLFLATKRVAELITWNTELSFEKQLSAYMQLINKQLNFIDKITNPTKKLDRAIFTHGRLLAHQEQIKELISSSDKPEEEKIFLTKYSDTFFASTYKKMEKFLPSYRDGYLVYPLAYPLIDREYGQYDGQLQIEGLSSGEVRPIFIDGKNDYLFWRTTAFPISSLQINWVRENDFFNTPIYSSMLDLPQGGKWLIGLSIKSTKQIKISVVSVDQQNYNPYYEESFNPSLSVKKLYRIINIEKNKKNPKIKLNVQVYGQDTQDYQNYLPTAISLSAQQLLDPEPPLLITKKIATSSETPKLTLKKLGRNLYLVNLINTNYVKSHLISLNLETLWKINSRNIIYYWPGIIFSSLFYLSLLILVYSILPILLKIPIDDLFSNILKKIFIFLMQILVLILRFTNKICQRFRLFFLTITISGIISETFIFQDSINVVVFFITLCWVATAIGYKLDSNINFFMAALSSAIFFILLIFKLEILANRFALWSVIFVLVGLFAVIIELNQVFSKRWNFFEFLKSAVYDWIYGLKRIIIIQILLTGILDIFRPKSNLLKDKLISLSKIAVAIFIFILLLQAKYYWGQLSYKMNQMPAINKYEPKIVYHSIKVIIKGSNFGAKENNQVKLMSSFGEVNTQKWTNNKIVFAVPLEWRTGPVDIWIERKFLYLGKEVNARSKIQTLQLIPINSTFTSQDDIFFDQLKHLNDETIKINGY